MAITRRILTERRQGRTFQAIAEALMADGIPTSRGVRRHTARGMRKITKGCRPTISTAAPTFHG
jgi:hypothetical protein